MGKQQHQQQRGALQSSSAADWRIYSDGSVGGPAVSRSWSQQLQQNTPQWTAVQHVDIRPQTETTEEEELQRARKGRT